MGILRRAFAIIDSEHKRRKVAWEGTGWIDKINEGDRMKENKKNEDKEAERDRRRRKTIE